MASFCVASNSSVGQKPAVRDTKEKDTSFLLFEITPASRSKPRRVRRAGSPRLQFLTATHPAQFKNDTAKKSVRSQAMIHYIHQTGRTKKKNHGSTGNKPKSLSPLPIRHISTKTQKDLGGSIWSFSDDIDLNWDELDLPNSWWQIPEAGGQTSMLKELSTPTKLTRHAHDGRRPKYEPHHGMMPQDSSLRRRRNNVVGYEDSDTHEEIGLRLLMASLRNIGDGVDPFMVLPQFRSPELNALFLQRQCLRAFGGDMSLSKWLPVMLSHPHVILSSVALASTWLDMHAGCSGDSRRTAMIKDEVIAMIKERLCCPRTRNDEATLAVIIHLLAGEVWACNEETIRIHVNGVARFVKQMGGMNNFRNETVAEIAASCCYQCDIICNATPVSPFDEWEPPELSFDVESVSMPESPVFNIGMDFRSFKNEDYCKTHTYNLLSDMRDLTDLFVSPHTTAESSHVMEEKGNPYMHSAATGRERDVSEISKRLANLPSAYTPGHPASDDWTYEACRLAGLIYTTAIVMRVPFPVAAQGRCISPNSDMTSTSAMGDNSQVNSLAEALYEVLKRTDIANLWNNMLGVLYWVSAVGAAAARTSAALDMTSPPRSQKEAYAIWVRRCLSMFSMRTVTLLMFQHPIPIILMQKNLLKVQELISSG